MPSIQDLFSLRGRAFMVVGGARDLGRDMAEALAESGGDGAITSRALESAQATARQLAVATGRRIIPLGVDACDPASVDQGVAQHMATFGRLDVLVLNVGGGAPATPDEPAVFEERRPQEWRRLMELNLTAPWIAAQRATRVMGAHPGGSVIFIASIAGIIGRDRRVYQGGMRPQTLDYAAAKAGVIGLMRDMAAYLAPRGIRVNAISPGGFERGQPKPFVAGYADKTMLGRMGRDGVDIKGAVAFLASDAAAYVTAHNLVVDGGFSAWQ